MSNQPSNALQITDTLIHGKRVLNDNGLLFDCLANSKPQLRVELAAPRLMILTQRERPIILASVAPDYSYVQFYRNTGYASVIPALRSAHARALYSLDDPLTHWMYYFAEQLLANPNAPLHTSRWLLTRNTYLPPLISHDDYRSPLVATDPYGELDWFVNHSLILPLHALSQETEGRVKAYRKMAREGTLAPILLWWVDGLATHVILDGHERLVAALAENITPPILALMRVDKDNAAENVRDCVEKNLPIFNLFAEEFAKKTLGATQALQGFQDSFLKNLDRATATRGKTWAWSLRGGTEQWLKIAQSCDPRWVRTLFDLGHIVHKR